MLDYWIAVLVRDTRKICPWWGRPMKGGVSLRDTWVIWGRRPKKAKTTIYCTATVCWMLNTHHPHPDNNPSRQRVCGMFCRRGRGSIGSPRAEQWHRDEKPPTRISKACAFFGTPGFELESDYKIHILLLPCCSLKPPTHAIQFSNRDKMHLHYVSLAATSSSLTT